MDWGYVYQPNEEVGGGGAGWIGDMFINPMRKRKGEEQGGLGICLSLTKYL